MMPAYYNEIDPFCVQWLQNLMDAGMIAQGIIDDRSIEDVRPSDLVGFNQCHFFAGIGVWSYALRAAGWNDDRPAWTGSCPCQPFSAAGKGKGFADERHLWPSFFYLIEKCRPPAVFGEQVGSCDGLSWLDIVQADLEGLGYACGAIITPAAGYGAPHQRHRLYFVANDGSGGCDTSIAGNTRKESAAQPNGDDASGCGGAGGALADTSSKGLEGRPGRTESERESTSVPGPTSGFWSDAIWLPCKDGKTRPTKPGIFPLAHGAAGRVGRLRGYGNCIVAPQAIEFVRAFMDYQNEINRGRIS